MMQYFNALGGGVLLDIYSESEVEKIVTDYISLLLNKENPIITEDIDLSEDDTIS